MKKLLSLLSVLTISGTAIPTTIAASPYQKEKNLNSDINYQQTNNLEKLNRIKRDSNIINIKGKIKDINYLTNDGKEIWTAIIPGSYDTYFVDKFNITEITGINNWSEFDLLYKYFSFIPSSSDSSISFYRKDGNGSGFGKSFYFKDIKFSDTKKYEHNIEGLDNFEDTFAISNGYTGSISAKAQKGIDVAFNYYKEKIFDESIWYGLSKVKVSFFVTIERYKINNELILRLIYKLNNYSAFSNSGINFKISGLGNYKIS